MYFQGNQREKALSNIQKAVDNASSMSERQQFAIRYFYFIAHGDIKKATKLLQAWKELYPYDVKPRQMLYGFYKQMSDPENAEKEALEMLDKGLSNRMLLSLANLYKNLGQTDKAEKYYAEFAKAYPEKATLTPEIGELYMAKGEFEKAKEVFEKLELINAE